MPITLRPGWTSDTFIDSDSAEAALCADRSAFVRQDLKAFISRDIWLPIIHPGDSAQIQGFRDLFILLNTDPAVDNLRQLVVKYFNDSPPLRGHLSEL